ncbi:MAG: methyltransferase domain-containing protein [Thermodesulfobacteriota bacterium]
MPRPETRGRHLDHVAWLYDPLVERMSFGREARFRQRTLAWMDIRPGQRILDVGCGTGSLTLKIGEALAGSGSVTGIDAAPRMIAIARKKAAARGAAVRFETMAAERLDFGAAVFDTVVSSMFTHHIDTELKHRAFAGMYRVLRPGGLLVTADIDRPTTPLARLVGWLSRYLLLQPELLDNLRGDLPAIMAAAGFAGIGRREHLHGLVTFFTAVKPGATG